ncbi:MAG: ABC transporter substrate-binding protein [Desulfovibrio sp.]|jgi:polar amino acid transport system substrate-binding protein|nr:ABC transporter substrate-binding protein [Desulfovibrio sp.]
MRYTEKIKFFPFLPILALMLCCSRPVEVRAEKILKIGVEGNCPPFSYEEEGGLSGFNVEIARALCVAMGRRCEFFAMPRDGLRTELREGRLDLVMDVRATSGCSEYMAFSAPYFHARFIYVGRIPRGRIEENRPVRIGVCAGGGLQRYLEETDALPHGTVVADEAGNIFAALRKGELDVMLVNSLQAYAFLASGAGGQFETVGDPLPLEAFSTSHHIGMRKDDGNLGAAVDRALQEMRYNGLFLQINRAWFSHTLY